MKEYDPKDYWNHRAEKWSTLLIYRYPDEELRIMMRYNEIAPSKVLEVGPGMGRGFITLLKAGMERDDYTAIDISIGMSDKMFKFTGVRPGIWDGKTLPFDDEVFDFLLSYDVLLHVKPENIENHISELVRVSRDALYIVTYAGGRSSHHSFVHDYKGIFDRMGLSCETWKFADDRVHYIIRKKQGLIE